MERFFEYLDNELFCHHSLDSLPEPSSFSMHVHEHMELFFLLSGSGQYVVEGSYYPLHADDILIARSAETHQLLLTSGTPYERISILFDASIIRGIDPEGYLLRPFLNRPLGFNNCYSSDSTANQKIKALFHSFDFDGSNAQKRVHIIRILLTSLIEISNEFEGIVSARYQGANNVAQELIHYVNAELFNDISITAISKKFFLSESQVSRIFKEATGSALWDYVRAKRLLAAREKILAGERITSACSSCGFQDYSVFYRGYKKRFGISPAETVSHKAVFSEEKVLS